MIKIYKYELEITDTQTVQMQEGAYFLHVDNQGDKLCLWAEVNLENEMVDEEFVIIGTGHEVPFSDDINGEDECSLDYVGTAVMPNGLVWHVYRKYYW